MRLYPTVCESCVTCIYHRRTRGYFCQLTGREIAEGDIYTKEWAAEGFPSHCPLKEV